MSEATAPNATATVTFNIKSGSQKWSLTLPLTTTAADLKSKLSAEEYANVPATSQRLIYSGKVLKDSDTLASHSVKDGNTMHLVKSAASNQRQNPATPSSTVPNAGTPQNAGVPQNLASGTGNDPLAGLTGARYAGFAGLPSLDSLANPPTPDEMIRRLQDPNFAQQMNEALQNPQMIDMMINSNPQLRAMGPQARQMLQSDHFRRMMTDPQALRSMMQLQNAMGMDPFGGMGGAGQSAFPAPGVTNPAEQQQQQEGQTGGQPQGQAQNQQQALANLLQGMHGGLNSNNPSSQQNPFLAFMNPPTGASPGQTPTTGTDGSSIQNSASNTGAAEPNNQLPQGLHPLFEQLMSQGSTNEPNNPRGPFADLFARMLADRMANDPSGAFGPNALLGGGLPQADLDAIFGGLGGAGGTAPADNRPPEERYATQLRQLNEMGFHDFDRNITALSRSGGDVNGALEYLFSQPQ